MFAREMEAMLIDAALAMFDKMLGAVFRRADRAHKDNVVDRAETLDTSARALLDMAKAMLAAKANNEDQVAAVERALGWERLKTLVAETEAAVADTRPDNLGEVVERYASVRRMSPVILGAFVFRSWKDNDPSSRRSTWCASFRERREETSVAHAHEFSASSMAQARQDRRRNRSPGL